MPQVERSPQAHVPTPRRGMDTSLPASVYESGPMRHRTRSPAAEVDRPGLEDVVPVDDEHPLVLGHRRIHMRRGHPDALPDPDGPARCEGDVLVGAEPDL